ncbi:MAG: hypothetical protein H6754_05080 [Candidatus Omnitrophica bacterium]|nr:hypothetical protein [Candidatus Omnitrophota bacterium]
MIQQIIKKILSSFVLVKVIKNYKSRSSLMKINAAKAYVHGVRKTRMLFIGILIVSISFVFLINGLILIQNALFTFSMWSNETKFIVALWLGGIEFLAAVGVFVYLLRENTWSQFFRINEVVRFVLGDKPKRKAGTR